jgi:hypothetical protein
MTNLRDRLDRLTGPTHPVTKIQAAADLARARQALRRRRTIQGTATGIFAVTAAVAAIAYGTADLPRDSSAPSAAVRPAATRPVTTEPSTSTVVTTRLVAYHGQQPKGYTIDKVPAGWEIQGNDPSVLTIAPIDARNQDPHDWIGKIAVMLQSKEDHSKPSGTAVKVAGKPGVIAAGDPSTTKILYVKQLNGVHLMIQIWDARGWSNDAIVTFGAGIHVLPNAQRGIG